MRALLAPIVRHQTALLSSLRARIATSAAHGPVYLADSARFADKRGSAALTLAGTAGFDSLDGTGCVPSQPCLV